MKHWSEYCTLSLVHFMAFPEMASGEGPFVESICQVAGMGFFGALEMGPINDPSTRRAVRQVTRDLGLKTAFGAQPVILSQGLDLNHLESAVRCEALKKLQDAVDQASEIEAESFVVLSGKYPGPEHSLMAYQYLADSLRKLAEYSQHRGIRTVLEVFDRAVDKKALVGPAREAAGLADVIRMEHPEFGLLYDMGHMPLLSETPEEALAVLAPHLAEVHLGNCVLTSEHPCYGDKHPRFGYPGGVNDTAELAQFIKALFTVEYLGGETPQGQRPWVGFEVKPQAGETTQAILENIKTTWETAWEQALSSLAVNE